VPAPVPTPRPRLEEVELSGGRPAARAPASRSGLWTGLGLAGGLAAIGAVVVLEHNPSLLHPTPAPVVAAEPKPAPTPEPKPAPVAVAPAPEPKPAPIAAVAPTPAPTPAPAPVPAPVAHVEAAPEPKPEPKAIAPAANHHKHEPKAEPAVAHAPTPSPAPTPAPAPEPAPVVQVAHVVIKQEQSEPAAAPKTSSSEPGSLVLRVAPWAEVEIDGTAYGVTPMAPVKLMAGEHQVRLKNGELHADRMIKVKIQSGAPETLKVNLAVP
jgi:hypothetical protein